MVIIAQKVSLSIANCNVNPRQLFSSLSRRNDALKVLINHFIKPTIARKTISFDLCFRVHAILNDLIDCFRRKIRHRLHFEKLTPGVLLIFLRVFNIFGLRHNQNGRLRFATTPPFAFLPGFANCRRFNCREVSFIHFCKPEKFMLVIPSAHSHSNLLYHKPYRLITLKAKLPLYFLRRYTFLGRGHQMHNYVPIPEGKIRRFHYRSTSQSCSGSTSFTLKLFNRLHPVMFGSFAFPTRNAFFLTLFPKMIFARLFVGKLFDKIDKLHIHNFDTKLLVGNVTYLRWYIIPYNHNRFYSPS